MRTRHYRRRGIGAVVLLAGVAVTLSACEPTTADRWGYSHLYLRGQVRDTLGAVVPHATVSVQVVPTAGTAGCSTVGSTPATIASSTTDAAGRFGFEVQSVPQTTPFHACLTVGVDPHTGLAAIAWAEGQFVGKDTPPDTATVNFIVNP